MIQKPLSHKELINQKNQYRFNDKGKIIFLNGASSSGKTTTAQELLITLDGPFLYHSLDGFGDIIEEGFGSWMKQYNITGPKVSEDVISAYHHSIAQLAAKGINLIADHVVWVESWGQELAELLDGSDVILVGVHCPLEELVNRERTRSDARIIGTAKLQFDKVHVHKTYDIEIDTSQLTPFECAEMIGNYLKKRDRQLVPEKPVSEKFYSK